MNQINIFVRSANQITPRYNGEPDYNTYIDPKMIRRMSRIVKMGVVSAMVCLKNSDIEMPGAILTATAYGCLEDSSQFLRRMIEFEEKMLSPTAFIQSTHNTVGAQIALLLKCHQYNNTIVHRAFSFENALIESALLLQEGIPTVLTGAIDENTDDLQRVLSRFGVYRSGSVLPGESASFFLLEKEKTAGTLALLKAVKTFYGSLSPEGLQNQILQTLKDNDISVNEIDLILTAYPNDKKNENDQVLNKMSAAIQRFSFPALCGNFPTCSGFGLWLATELLSKQKSPTQDLHINFPLKYILILVENDRNHHSLMLLSVC
jgi:3-oxoacyl-[acyl-carrier-protein] synthase II